MTKELEINDIKPIDEIICLTDETALSINGGVSGPPGLAKKASTGFALTRPGLIKNIREENGFAGANAGNGANSGGDGNNGFQTAPI